VQERIQSLSSGYVAPGPHLDSFPDLEEGKDETEGLVSSRGQLVLESASADPRALSEGDSIFIADHEEEESSSSSEEDEDDNDIVGSALPPSLLLLSSLSVSLFPGTCSRGSSRTGGWLAQRWSKGQAAEEHCATCTSDRIGDMIALVTIVDEQCPTAAQLSTSLVDDRC
jgi:hypothetical protein